MTTIQNDSENYMYIRYCKLVTVNYCVAIKIISKGFNDWTKLQ